MSDRLRGDRLYVNLSASATRARLAGRGLGVRKVHSAGHRQAVVIHTAVGRHRETLQDLFADVGWSTTEQGLNRAGREGPPDDSPPVSPRPAEEGWPETP